VLHKQEEVIAYGVLNSEIRNLLNFVSCTSYWWDWWWISMVWICQTFHQIGWISEIHCDSDQMSMKWRRNCPSILWNNHSLCLSVPKNTKSLDSIDRNRFEIDFILGSRTSKKVDVSTYGLEPTPERTAFMDLSYPIKMVTKRFLQPMPEEESRLMATTWPFAVHVTNHVFTCYQTRRFISVCCYLHTG